MERLFKSGNDERDAYLSRVFGIFNEKIVTTWCKGAAPYEDLGRPTVFKHGESGFATLDFTLRNRASGQVYVAELKCELQFENYKYLRLSDPGQLRHHGLKAFQWFCDLALNQSDYHVKVKGRPCEVHGAILIWGATTPEGVDAVKRLYRFQDVLSLEDMITALNAQTGCQDYRNLIIERDTWWRQLVMGLLGEA